MAGALFDPLGFSKQPDEFAEQAVKEIKNGRLVSARSLLLLHGMACLQVLGKTQNQRFSSLCRLCMYSYRGVLSCSNIFVCKGIQNCWSYQKGLPCTRDWVLTHSRCSVLCTLTAGYGSLPWLLCAGEHRWPCTSSFSLIHCGLLLPCACTADFLSN